MWASRPDIAHRLFEQGSNFMPHITKIQSDQANQVPAMLYQTESHSLTAASVTHIYPDYYNAETAKTSRLQ
jgi:hypothetical protein